MPSIQEQVAAWKNSHASEFVPGCPLSKTITWSACSRRRARVEYYEQIWEYRNTNKRKTKPTVPSDIELKGDWDKSIISAHCPSCTIWKNHEQEQSD